MFAISIAGRMSVVPMSTLTIGAAKPVTIVKRSMPPLPRLGALPGIGNTPGKRRRGNGRRAGEMGDGAASLASLVIPVRRADDPPPRNPVAAIVPTQPTAGLVPFEAGGQENLVEAFCFRLGLHSAGSWNANRSDRLGHAPIP